MPKIIIREYDNTKAGSLAYANFSVVVPGTCAADKGTKALGFDDYGIQEISTQAEFIEKVGKVKGNSESTVATAPVREVLGTEGEGEEKHNIYKKALTANEFFVTYKNCCYTVATAESSVTSVGKLIYSETVGGTTTFYKCTKAEEWGATTQYVVILPGNEGNDLITNNMLQNGNQIAYELLGLGYKVLYKIYKETGIYDKDTGEERQAEEAGKTVKGLEVLQCDWFWEPLKDKSTYSFRYVCTGGYYNSVAYAAICKLANYENNEALEDLEIKGRGDCIALVDINEVNFEQRTIVKNIQNAIKSLTYLNKFSALFCPKVTYAGDKDAIYDNLTFPASFHYLACAAYARNELNYNEWYATSGYTRGICGKQVAGTSFKLGEIAANALQPRLQSTDISHAVNIITNIRGNYYVWGNRTARELNNASSKNPGLIASHFLNIRQLCCTLKQEIYGICKSLTFEPNSDLLWGNFCNMIKPTLEKMKADQGIADYKITKVKTDKKALLVAKVRIVPIEAVEDFDISICLEDSISGITIGTDEAE